jgi:hypothetical protein
MLSVLVVSILVQLPAPPLTLILPSCLTLIEFWYAWYECLVTFEMDRNSRNAAMGI